MVTVLVKLKIYRTQVKPDEVQRGLTAPLPVPGHLISLPKNTLSFSLLENAPHTFAWSWFPQCCTSCLFVSRVLGAETVLEGDVCVSVKH